MIIIKKFKPNDLAYLDYDRSYDRNTVIVLATGQYSLMTVTSLL